MRVSEATYEKSYMNGKRINTWYKAVALFLVVLMVLSLVAVLFTQ